MESIDEDSASDDQVHQGPPSSAKRYVELRLDDRGSDRMCISDSSKRIISESEDEVDDQYVCGIRQC